MNFTTWAVLRDIDKWKRVRPSLSVFVTVLLASSAIASLFILHSYANKRHQAEVMLLRLAEGSTEHGQLQWKVLAEGRYDQALDREHMKVHSKIDGNKRELATALGKDDHRYELVVGRYDAYHSSIAEVFALVKKGNIEEATARDESTVRLVFWRTARESGDFTRFIAGRREAS